VLISRPENASLNPSQLAAETLLDDLNDLRGGHHG